MTARPCPHAIGETFTIDLDDLEIDESINIRRIDRTALRGLAESMRAERGGQMHAVQVCWTGARYAVAAGFRRALAKWTFRDEMGFTTIDVRLISADEAPLRRLSENFDRSEPPSFDTCKYLYRLFTGADGHPKRPLQEIANAIHMSAGHTETLIRFYRELPEDIRQKWAADDDGRFNYRVLSKLASLARAGKMEEVRTCVEQLLANASSSVIAGEPSSTAKRTSNIQCGGKIVRAARSGLRRRVSDLAQRLAAAGTDRILEDDRATLILELLQCLSGDLPKKRADEIISMLLADLAAAPVDDGRQ